MAYGQDNRITAYNGENITFDADGNMTSGPLNGSTAAYKYDCRNRLISVGNTQYVYDALNNRIAVIENGNKISYVINPNASLSQVLIKKDAAGSEIFYVYGLGLISEEDLNGIYRIYHFDSRGNTVALTDKVGNITDRFQYDIYGKLVTCAGTSKTPFLYVGKDGVMTDSNGLYYMRARYYNTDMNRFVNQDVVVGNIQDSQSLNQFAYATDNPISKIDPMGNFPWKKVGETVKALGDIVVGGFTVAGGVGIATASDGIGIVPAAAIVNHGVASMFSGGMDIYDIWCGDENKVGTHNYVENGYKEASKALFGKEKYGDEAFQVVDLGLTFLSGKEVLKLANPVGEFVDTAKGLKYNKNEYGFYKWAKAEGLAKTEDGFKIAGEDSKLLGQEFTNVYGRGMDMFQFAKLALK